MLLDSFLTPAEKSPSKKNADESEDLDRNDARQMNQDDVEMSVASGHENFDQNVGVDQFEQNEAESINENVHEDRDVDEVAQFGQNGDQSDHEDVSNEGVNRVAQVEQIEAAPTREYNYEIFKKKITNNSNF